MMITGVFTGIFRLRELYVLTCRHIMASTSTCVSVSLFLPSSILCWKQNK